MKKKQILAFKDEKFESEVVTDVEKTRAKLQKMVNEFNALGLGNVAPNEIDTLVRTPDRLFSKRTDLIEVPKGLSRAKYLMLMELPSLVGVLQAREDLLKSAYCMSFELFTLSGDEVGINADELDRLKTSQNIYVDENSPELAAIERIKTFVVFINEYSELLSPHHSNPLTKVCSFRETKGNKYEAYLTKKDIQNHLKNGRHSKETTLY